MKVEQGKSVSVSYELTVDGNVLDTIMAAEPFKFNYGTSDLLQKYAFH